MTLPGWPYSGIHDFIQRHNLKGRSQDDIAKAKKLYWKHWQKHYDSHRRSTHRKFTVCLKRDCYDRMKEHCARRSVSVAGFASEAIEARLGQQVRMDEGTRSVLRVLSGMGARLDEYVKHQGKIPNELPQILMTIRDCQSHILSAYDIQG